MVNFAGRNALNYVGKPMRRQWCMHANVAQITAADHANA